MSNEATTQEVEHASQIVFERAYVPGLLKRAAERGIPIRNEAELEAALENIYMLKAAQAAEQQGAAGQDMHKAANAALRDLFGENIEETEAAVAHDAVAESVIDELGGDTDVVKAATLIGELRDTKD